MTIIEFLRGDVIVKSVQKALGAVRTGGGTGEIVIRLNLKEGVFLSGKVETTVLATRLDARSFTPE